MAQIQVIFKECKINQIKFGCMELWNPDFRNMDIMEVRIKSKIDQEYVPYGYSVFLFCRTTATIYAYNEK